MFTDPHFIAGASFGLLLYYFWYTRWFKPAITKYLPFPPSPRDQPFIGNLNILDMPNTSQWKACHSWCEEFNSTILYLNTEGQNVIVLDTYEDCIELLERRSSVYAGNPRMTMMNERVGWRFSFGWINYGNIWRDRRRLMHDAFHLDAVKSFRPIQLKSARKLLLRLKAQTNILRELNSMAEETIIAVTSKLDLEPKDDSYIKAAEEGSFPLLEAAVPGTMYQAGADLDMAVGILGFCILSMLDHPECLEKIETEMQSVTGNFSRLPGFEDEDALPYLMAFIKEVMRWWDVTPIASPRLIEVDEEYKWHRIPAGATVVANSWAIFHDEAIYPAPFTFNPDRFLTGNNVEAASARFNVSWAHGRRVCPDRYFAAASVWITLALIIAVYKVSKTKDENGNVIEPSHEYSTALLLVPKEFDCSFVLRSKEVEQLMVWAEEMEV